MKPHDGSHHESHDHHDEHGHQAGHHHHIPADINIHSRVFRWAIGLNLLYVGIEIFYGFKIHSLSLLADAIHNFGDVCGLLLAWLGFVLLSQKPTYKMTFGLKKFSIFAAFLNSLFLVLSTLWIIKEAFEHYQSAAGIPGEKIIVVAGIGVIINFSTALLFHKSSHDDLNMKAAFTHLMADAAVSAGVIVAGLFIYNNGPAWIDSVSSVIISVVVLLTTWGLLKESFLLILGGVPKKINTEKVKAYLQKQAGITEVHSLHIWAISTSEIMMTAHLVMPEGHPADQFIADLRHQMVHHFAIQNVTFQIEVKDQNCK